jgi:hypothetical protein
MPIEAIKRLSPGKARRCLKTIEEKKVWFDNQCNKLRISFLEDSITLVIDREKILRDSFEQFRTTDAFDLHKEIKIFYIGEKA